MLSALVLPPSRAGRSRPDLILRTLAALVPTAIEGVVRDVALVHLGADEVMVEIAREAGCASVIAADFASAFARGVVQARAPWLLVLRAGALPGRAFGTEVAARLGGAGTREPALVLREERGAFRGILGALLPVAGVIARREAWARAPCRDFADVVRRARPARDLGTRAPVLA